MTLTEQLAAVPRYAEYLEGLGGHVLPQQDKKAMALRTAARAVLEAAQGWPTIGKTAQGLVLQAPTEAACCEDRKDTEMSPDLETLTANLNTSWTVFQRVATMLQESLEIYQTQCAPTAFDQVVQQVNLLTRAMHDINVDTARVAQTVQADRAWVHAMVQEMERRQEDTELELQLQAHFCNQWWVRYCLAEALAGAE